MQLELDEQVHQYDADTWGERGEQKEEERKKENEYLGQIRPGLKHCHMNSDQPLKIALTSNTVKICSSGLLSSAQTTGDWTATVCEKPRRLPQTNNGA